MAWFECIGGNGGGGTHTPLYSIDQSQGAVWVNTNILVSGITSFLFVNSSNGTQNIARSIPVADIPVYSGGADVYMTIFPAGYIGKDFNIRIYNGTLYVSYNQVGSNTNVVSIYDCEMDI